MAGRGRIVSDGDDDDEAGLDLPPLHPDKDDDHRNSTRMKVPIPKSFGASQKQRKGYSKKNRTTKHGTSKPAELPENHTMAEPNKTGESLQSPPPSSTLPPPLSEVDNQTVKDAVSLDPDLGENDPDPEGKDPETKETGLDSGDDDSEEKEKDLDSEENDLDSKDNVTESKGNVTESKGNDQEPKEEGQLSGSAPLACGESHCAIPNTSVNACLRTPDDGTHTLALSIRHEGDTKADDGDISVKVTAPDFLVANPSEVSVRKGSSETIEFKINPKLDVSNLNIKESILITVTVSSTNGGECKIELPIDYLQNITEKKDFLRFFPSNAYAALAFGTTPMVSAIALFSVVVLTSAAGWLCHRFCRRKKNVDSVKYQQLEMVEPEAQKERVNEASDGWDETWDDDWEDSEAAKSSMSQGLSSTGLAARRGNKDGWDD